MTTRYIRPSSGIVQAGTFYSNRNAGSLPTDPPGNVVDLFTRRPILSTSASEQPASPISITARAGTHGSSVQISTIASLLDAMISGDEAAEQRLIDIGEQAVEPLCSVVDDKDLGICVTAIKALGKLGDARAIDPLFKMLDANDHQEIRPHVKQALLEIGGMKVVAVLIERLSRRSKNEGVCWSAIDILGKLADERAFKPLLGLFDHERLEIGLAVINALEAIDRERLVDESFARLGRREEVVRNRAIRVLTKIGGRQIVDRLIDALSDEHADVRRCAAYVLGNIADKRATSHLIDLLQDDDEGVSRAASYALYEIGFKVPRFHWMPLSNQS